MLLATLQSNSRKRTGPDSSPSERPATSAPHNVSHDDRPPKPPGPQSAVLPPMWALAPVLGDLTSGT